VPEGSPEEAEPSKPSGLRLPSRIVTGLLLAGLVFGTLFTSRVAWFVVVSTAVLLAQHELYRAFTHRALRPAWKLGGAIGAALLASAFAGSSTALTFALSVSVAAALLWFLADPERSEVSERLSTTLFGVLYVPFLGAHFVLLRDLEHGPAITIAVIGLTAFYDIAAFTTGSLAGRRPFAPSVSPRKTIEGAAGATVFIFVLALFVGPFIEPFTAASAAALAAVVAVAAPLGDLAESLLKRDLGIKDMGGILPGHGGLLDRIDALLYVAAPAYWVVRAFTA